MWRRIHSAHRGIEHGIGGVDAHAAGVGTGVALADALVVLRGHKRRHVLAVAQAEKADLVAFKELLDHYLALRLAQQRAREQTLGSLGGGVARGADNDALARSQPVGFDHDRRMKDLDGFFDFGRAGADGVVGRGDVVAMQELLGEAFAGLEHGGGARGAKDAQAALLERVDNAERERQLRPDDGEAGLLGLGQADHRGEVFEVDWNAARDLRHAAVARRANNLSDARAARNRPGQRVFAAPGTKDQDFHWYCTFRSFYRCGA